MYFENIAYCFVIKICVCIKIVDVPDAYVDASTIFSDVVERAKLRKSTSAKYTRQQKLNNN